MNLRAFDWRDLPTLHRYRRQSVFLDSALLLTRGPWLLRGAMVSSVSPAMGIITSVYERNNGNDEILFGQSMHWAGSQFAHLTFLTPADTLDASDLLPLLEHQSVYLGERGAMRLLAEVDEHTNAFEALRRSGFAIYSRQRFWKLAENLDTSTPEESWQPARGVDEIPVRALYNNVAPGLVQQVEPFLSEELHGLVLRHGDALLAYAEIKQGHRGIWVQPIVHPDVENLSGLLAGLLRHLPYRPTRPVYVCVRSYMSWLEPVLEDLGVEAGERQAVMVRHLAIAQKSARPFALPALETGHPEISAPIAHSENKS